MGGKLAGGKMTADSEPGSASIVPMAANHLGDVAAPCKELGYDAQTEDVGARFGELKNDPDSGLIVAPPGATGGMAPGGWHGPRPGPRNVAFPAW